MGRPVLCQTCLYCGACTKGNNTSVVRKHCQRFHKKETLVPGVSPSGRSWRRLNDTYPHIFVSLPWDNPEANGKVAVGLCSLCGEHWHPHPGGHFPRAGAEAWFATHTCHTPQVRTYKAPEATGGAGMSAKAAVPRGNIITGPHLEALHKKYPGFGLEWDDSGADWTVDVMATLETAARDCDRLVRMEEAARKAPVSATGDFFTAALTALKETPSLTAHVQATWDAEKRNYETDLADWEDEDEHDEDATAPDPANIPRNTLATLATRSAKFEAAQQTNKAAIARAVASVEAELAVQRSENSRLLSRTVNLESTVTSMSAENSRLSAEIAALRSALAAAKLESES
jgi:hypothetical protein